MTTKRWKPNYKYQIKSTIQVESRKSYIKNLRASALYMEEQVTDEDFLLFATGVKPHPEIDTYKIEDLLMLAEEEE